jgi:hypothetical protein
MAAKFTKTDLSKGSKQLADHLCGELQDAIDARHGLKQRWEQNEQVYRNEPGIAAVRLYDNFEPRTVPILSPRVNRIVNVTMTAVSSPSVWVQAVPDDADLQQANELEHGMQTIMERAGFLRLLRRALTTTALCGVGIVRARMTGEGIKLDHVHPNDFVVAPTYGLDLKDTSLVGHRFYIPVWKLEERIKSGAYPLVAKTETTAKFAGTDPDNDPSGRDPSYDLTQNTQDMVELFEVLVRLTVEGRTKWHRAVVSPTANRVLLIEPYPYDRPWYADLRFHDEEGKFWPSSSVAQNIVGLCLLQNDMFNLMVAGSMATCANPVVISGGSLGKKIKAINLGHLYETAYDVKVQEIPIRFEPGAMPSVMDAIDNQIDAQTGVSQLSIGQEFLQNQTATAANALIAATKENESAYAAFAADFIEGVWAFVHSICRTHASLVRQVYKRALSDSFFESLSAEVRWQSAARTPGSAPAMMLQKLQLLLELAAEEGSGYDYRRVEDAVVDAMRLPLNTQRLKKDA